MGPFSAAVDFLNAAGFFQFLAYLLVFIVLYYSLLHVFEKHVKRISNPLRRKALSLLISLLMVFLLLVVGFGSSSGLMSVVVMMIVLTMILIIVIMATARLFGLEFKMKF